MISQEKEEVIERKLFGKETPDDQKQFDVWMIEDAEFRETFEFRKHLGAQLRLKRRNELKQTFKQIEEEMAAERKPHIIPIWRQSWFVAAASVVILVGVFWIFKDSFITPKPEQISKNDTTSPSKDSTYANKVTKVPVISDSIKKTTPKPDIRPQARELPLYETNDLSLGFGKNEKPSNVLPVLFIPNSQWQYEYEEDTLKIYIPTSEWSQKWILIYNRPQDEYLLSNSKEKYSITKGLKGKKTLKKINQR